MTASRDLREAILRTAAVGKAITETAKAVKAEASAATSATGPQREDTSGPRNGD